MLLSITFEFEWEEVIIHGRIYKPMFSSNDGKGDEMPVNTTWCVRDEIFKDILLANMFCGSI